MIPLGDFDSFLREINGHYNDENYCGDDEICFGILLVDYGQEECREWILNYLSEFHFISREYFNFFVPGYVYPWEYHGERNRDSIDTIRVDEMEYVFSRKMYTNFRRKLFDIFQIHYTTEPLLILVSKRRDYWEGCQYIVVELNNLPKGLMTCGDFFTRIFTTAMTSWDLNEIGEGCRCWLFVRRKVFSKILGGLLNGNFLEEVVTTGNELYRLHIRTIGR